MMNGIVRKTQPTEKYPAPVLSFFRKHTKTAIGLIMLSAGISGCSSMKTYGSMSKAEYRQLWDKKENCFIRSEVIDIGGILSSGDVMIQLANISQKKGRKHLHWATLKFLDAKTGAVTKVKEIPPMSQTEFAVNGQKYLLDCSIITLFNSDGTRGQAWLSLFSVVQ